MAAAEDDMAGLLDWLEAESAARSLDVRLQTALLRLATNSAVRSAHAHSIKSGILKVQGEDAYVKL